ncbi:MAG: hypothetical protein JXQ27_10055 [Acidobacteria bacterium]|nr:hypothetical protein [Acidobacteriota bacterium]
MKDLPGCYRVIVPYMSPYPEPLVFRQRDRVAVGDEFADDPDWPNWRWCERADGLTAWVPEQFLVIQGSEGVFTRDYNALELSVAVGDELVIHEEVNGFGMAETADGRRGWVPMKHLAACQV